MSDLLPCPFCGQSKALEIVTASSYQEYPDEYPHSESWAVICNASTDDKLGGCGAMGGFKGAESQAVALWNLRPKEIDMSEITLKKSGPGEETVFCDGLKCAYLSEVAASWDVQAVGKLIGAKPGTAICEQIEPFLRAIIAERDKLKTWKENAKNDLTYIVDIWRCE
jgi:hypothetical protein